MELRTQHRYHYQSPKLNLARLGAKKPEAYMSRRKVKPATAPYVPAGEQERREQRAWDQYMGLIENGAPQEHILKALAIYSAVRTQGGAKL